MRTKKACLSARQGFTLLEILLVVAAIGILAGIVIVAINPGKQMADTRDAQRKVDVSTIINAVYQYAVDNGSLPASITTSDLAICADGGDCTGIADLGVLTANGTYIVGIPNDPTDATTDQSGYTISKDANDRVTVTAPGAENTTISVTR